MIGRALRRGREYFHLVNSVLGIRNPHDGARLAALLVVLTLAVAWGGNAAHRPSSVQPLEHAGGLLVTSPGPGR